MRNLHFSAVFLVAAILCYSRVGFAADSLPPAEVPCGEEQTDLNYQIVNVSETTRLQAKNLKADLCTYRAHFRITKSNVTFDCQGARILGSRLDEEKSWEASFPALPTMEDPAVASPPAVRPPRPLYGLLISSLDGQPLDNVTIKNCNIEAFERNFGIENPLGTAITIEDSKSLNARAYGVYFTPKTGNVRLQKIEVMGSQASGIFWPEGSNRNVLSGSKIIDNGKSTAMPHQDGLTLDAAAQNQIIANLFEKNGMAGISLFTNCGEFGGKRPATGAGVNLIRNNHFKNEKIGAWIGSRQSMNQQHLGCSSRKTFDDSAWDIVEDFAKDNTLTKNTFTQNSIGVRVEDDNNKLIENTFTSDDPKATAILIGHRFGKPRALRQPVSKTRLEKNNAQMTAVAPFKYCFLQSGSELIANIVNGQPVTKLVLGSEGCAIHEGAMGEPAPTEEIRSLASEKDVESTDKKNSQKEESPQ